MSREISLGDDILTRGMKMERITRKHLVHLAGVLNKITGSPALAYGGEGQYQANIGNYHISGAYGGWALHRMETDGGGISDVLSSGHVPARNLHDRMQAYLAGIKLTGEEIQCGTVMNETDTLLKQILMRLARIETRLVKLMLHEGMETDGKEKLDTRESGV